MLNSSLRFEVVWKTRESILIFSTPGPIRSRTLLVRIPAPTEGEICEVLAKSGKKEGWPAARELEKRIAVESGRNLRRALLMFEAVHAQKYSFPHLQFFRS